MTEQTQPQKIIAITDNNGLNANLNNLRNTDGLPMVSGQITIRGDIHQSTRFFTQAGQEVIDVSNIVPQKTEKCPAIELRHYENKFHMMQTHQNRIKITTVASMAALGGFLGAKIGLLLSDRLESVIFGAVIGFFVGAFPAAKTILWPLNKFYFDRNKCQMIQKNKQMTQNYGQWGDTSDLPPKSDLKAKQQPVLSPV